MRTPLLTRLFSVMLLLAGLSVSPAAAQALLQQLQSPNPSFRGNFGRAVAGVPDVDGDGQGDLVVGTSGESEGIYVLSGATGAPLYTLSSPNSTFFFIQASGVPDADGDGRGDILLGVPNESVDGAIDAGRAYLFSGANGELLYTFAPPNAEEDGNFGGTVAGVPDADGDGLGDLLVGAPGESGGADGSGQAYLFSGANGELLYTLASPNPVALSNFGGTVDGVPDTDGDGLGDLLLTQDGNDRSQSDRVHLFSGATGELLYTVFSPNPEIDGFFSETIASVPDADGDDRGDFLVGASGESGGARAAGRSYLFSGASGDLLYTLRSPNAEVDGNFGRTVSGVPDADGDGLGDLVVGAPEEFADGIGRAGRAYLFSGATGDTLQTVTSANIERYGNFGIAVAGVPDADGDSRGDFLVGAPVEDINELNNAGRAYLFSGGAGTADDSGPALAINEFLADPDDSVDANGDGTTNSADEFVELFNGTAGTLDLGGYQIVDAIGNSYTFPNGTRLAFGAAATVFGGGTPTGVPGFTDTGLPGLNNSGDTITLLDPEGNTVDEVSYDGGEASGVSLARNPNGTGPFELQDTFGALTPETAGENNDSGAPIPVEFAGAPKATVEGDGTVVLAWSTLSETENAGFSVEYQRRGQSGWTVANEDGLIAGAPGGASSERQDYTFTISDLASGAYALRVKQQDTDGEPSYSAEVGAQVRAASFGLRAPYPNPASSAGQVTVPYEGAPEGAPVEAALYNSLGQQVRTLEPSGAGAGAGEIRFEAGGLASGVYFLRLVAGEQTASQSITLVR